MTVAEHENVRAFARRNHCASMADAIRLCLLEAAAECGEPAPTAGFDVLLLQNTYDVLEGTGINPSNTDPTRAVVRYAGTNCHPGIDETDVLVLRIRDSVEAGAVLSVRIFYTLGYR